MPQVVKSDTQERAATIAWIENRSRMTVERPTDEDFCDMLARIERAQAPSVIGKGRWLSSGCLTT